MVKLEIYEDMETLKAKIMSVGISLVKLGGDSAVVLVPTETIGNFKEEFEIEVTIRSAKKIIIEHKPGDHNIDKLCTP